MFVYICACSFWTVNRSINSAYNTTLNYKSNIENISIFIYLYVHIYRFYGRKNALLVDWKTKFHFLLATKIKLTHFVKDFFLRRVKTICHITQLNTAQHNTTTSSSLSSKNSKLLQLMMMIELILSWCKDENQTQLTNEWSIKREQINKSQNFIFYFMSNIPK